MRDLKNKLETLLMRPDTKSFDYVALGSIAIIVASIMLCVYMLFAL
jgi:hypothetical protein